MPTEKESKSKQQKMSNEKTELIIIFYDTTLNCTYYKFSVIFKPADMSYTVITARETMYKTKLISGGIHYD